MANRNPLDNLLSKIVNDINDSDSDYEDDLVDTFNINSTVAPPQPTVGLEDCFEVDALLDDRYVGITREFLVRWKDTQYPNEWIDQNNVNSSLIQRYELQKQVLQHNSTVQNNLLASALPSTRGKGFVYARTSDPEKTKTSFGKSCAQQHQHISEVLSGNSTTGVTSFGPGMQTFQNYCSSFPTANPSLDYQKNTCFKYCLQNNLEISGIEIDDGITARNPDKLPGLQTILRNIQEGDYLVFTDFSRFSRDAAKGIQILDFLSQKGVFVRSILDELNYDTPAARHNARQALSNAQFHSELTSQKIKESHQNIRDKGGYIGSIVPYGYKAYRDNGIRKLKEKKSEQVVIKFIKSYLNNNQLTRGDYKKLASTLNLQKHCYRGKSFTSSHIKTIIKKLRTDPSVNINIKPVSYVTNQIKREIAAINRSHQRKEKREEQHNLNRGIMTVGAPGNTDKASKSNLALSVKPMEVNVDSNSAPYNLRSTRGTIY
jgi:DNA invertase Pin-like site-specific DNA recombinase